MNFKTGHLRLRTFEPILRFYPYPYPYHSGCGDHGGINKIPLCGDLHVQYWIGLARGMDMRFLPNVFNLPH